MQTTLGEFLQNLTYQASSQENDNIFLSFKESINLTHSIVNEFAEMENREFEIASQVTEQISDKLDTSFEIVEAPAMKIQLGEEESINPEETKPIKFSVLLKTEEINEIYDREENGYLNIAIKLNQTELESASKDADSENEKLIQEINNATPGLVVDDDTSVDTQFSFKIVT